MFKKVSNTIIVGVFITAASVDPNTDCSCGLARVRTAGDPDAVFQLSDLSGRKSREIRRN
jgi:hypothetical protein